MNRLQILTATKALLATGSGQPDKHLAICFALDAATSRGKKTAEGIKTEIMEYLAPYITFRGKYGGEYNTDQVQALRHVYLDALIKKAAQ
jgi:hypothetical protein